MNFAFTEEQEELRKTVRQFLEAKSSEAAVREQMETEAGFDTAVWSQMAEQMGVPFLGRLPIYEPIRVGSDVGIPLVIAEPQSGASLAFMRVAEQMAVQVSVKAVRAEMENKGKIPLIPIR